MPDRTAPSPPTGPSPDVTVVVPTKNAARTLGVCLQSLRMQTYPCRTVVVDNGSTDGTKVIAEAGADVLLDIGPERSAQRNHGARTYPAEIVGFVDADMVVQPTVVEEAVAALQSGAGSVIVPERTVGSGFWVEVRAFERSFYDGSDAIEAARFFRWDVFDRAGGFDEQLTGAEDWDLSESARELAPVARTTAVIEHDEGTIGYLDACRKKAYYAEGVRRYVAKRGLAVIRQASRRPWMWQPRKLVTRYGMGLIALKVGEALALGAALARTRDVHRPTLTGKHGKGRGAQPNYKPTTETLDSVRPLLHRAARRPRMNHGLDQQEARRQRLAVRHRAAGGGPGAPERDMGATAPAALQHVARLLANHVARQQPLYARPNRQSSVVASAITEAHNRQTATATRHVAMVTDAFLSRGQWVGGGAERHLWHLARLAASHGVLVTVYQASEDPFDSEHDGIRVIGIPVSAHTIWSKAAGRAVADGATHLYFQYVDRLPLRPLSLPTSATSHGIFWDHPYDASMAAWYPHGRIDRMVLPPWRILQRHLVMTNIARCTAVLSTDSSFYHVVQSQAPQLRNRVHVVFNFSDLDNVASPAASNSDRAATVLAPLYQARSDERLVVLLPRNLSLVRGGGWLPQIVEGVTEATGGRCQFALCGEAVPTQGRASRYDAALASALAVLPPQVRACLSLLGGVPHELMNLAYELSDMVLIPTYSHESTSLAAIEAMARSRPVVATNVGGLSDVVVDGWTGLLVPPRVNAIVAAIVHLADDAVLRERLGHQGAIEARNLFTLQRWQERILPFMESSGWLG